MVEWGANNRFKDHLYPHHQEMISSIQNLPTSWNTCPLYLVARQEGGGRNQAPALFSPPLLWYLNTLRTGDVFNTVKLGTSAAARLLRSWVRIPPGAWIFVCCECRVLSGRGLCDELIPHPEESYRLWCVVVCDLETSWMRRPWPTGGLSCQKQTNKRTNIFYEPVPAAALSKA